MKNHLFSLLLLICCCFSLLQAQQITTAGLQWSSSRLSYNIPFEGFNMGSEMSAYGFIRWGSYLALVPEVGLRQQNQAFFRNEVEQMVYRIRSVQLK